MPDSVLTIDLGKTHCRAALWIGAIGTMAEGPGAPGLAAPGGAAQAEAAILAVAAPLLRAAGMAGIDAAGVGAAGALTAPDAAAELAERLCGSLAAGSVAVASDATAAHAGALGGEPGVVLAVGTGVVALAVGPDGAMHRADGWGPWLGDTGGGGWLGQQGLRAALRAADGSGPATSLQAAAIAQFGPIPNLVALITGDPAPARLLAEFAPAVAQAARDGDPVATSLLQEAAAALAATTCAAARALGASAPTRFAMVGGLAALGEVLARPLLAVLHQAMPSLDRVWARGTALDGARFLALHSGSLHEPAVCRRSAKAAAPNRLDLLATEGVRPGLDDLDQRPPGDIVRLLLAAERGAQEALGRAAPQLAAAAEAIAERMLAGGRLFYLGAGTPGRLAVLDAAELAPTYSAPPGLVVALLAGGPAAMIQAAEGAEDDSSAAAAALDSHDLRPGDAVVGIAASGRTPYVVGGLRHAQSRGALAVAIVNNPGSSAAAAADIAVEILTGAEVVAGSTRMTAGTTQKIALNALSTAAMVALGKTYGARMVDVRATNEKLRRRALRMVCEITGASEADAATALAAAGNRVKPAVVALLAGIDVAEADRRLAQAGGRVRDAIAS